MARVRTRCKYCGNKNLIEKYGQKWCTKCAPGRLDLKVYEESLATPHTEVNPIELQSTPTEDTVVAGE